MGCSHRFCKDWITWFLWTLHFLVFPRVWDWFGSFGYWRVQQVRRLGDDDRLVLLVFPFYWILDFKTDEWTLIEKKLTDIGLY